MRFQFDERKSERLRANAKRGIGFEEAQGLFAHPYYLDERSDCPEQYRAIGWVGDSLYSVIFHVCATRCAKTSKESTTTL